MITKYDRVWSALAAALLLAVAAEARPVRVGMFRGIGGTDFWHTNIHTAATVMAQILANPAAAGLGDSLVVPKDGFAFYSMPVAPNSEGTGECVGNGCRPTPAQLSAIVQALDTLDVLVLNSNTNLGAILGDAGQREAFERFWSTKGLVSVHATTDSKGAWAGLDSAHGARFRSIPAEQDGKVRLDSAHQTDADWRFLNKGLFSAGRDTTFFDEWMYFIESGATIRSRAHLKPTLKLDESSIASPGSTAPMGDHPLSWYRRLPTGGRVFYTGLGHRSQVWLNTRLFRRQVYNAILWAARVDSNGVVSVRGLPPAKARFSLRAERNHLHFASELPARVSVRALDGRLTARGEGADLRFALRAGAYAVTAETPDGAISARRVVVP